MTKYLTILLVALSTFYFADNAMSQSCRDKARELKKDMENLKPNSKLELAFYETCDEVQSMVYKAGTVTNWYVGQLIDELRDLTYDVKEGQCTSGTCKKAESIKKKIKNALDE